MFLEEILHQFHHWNILIFLNSIISITIHRLSCHYDSHLETVYSLVMEIFILHITCVFSMRQFWIALMLIPIALIFKFKRFQMSALRVHCFITYVHAQSTIRMLPVCGIISKCILQISQVIRMILWSCKFFQCCQRQWFIFFSCHILFLSFQVNLFCQSTSHVPFSHTGLFIHTSGIQVWFDFNGNLL